MQRQLLHKLFQFSTVKSAKSPIGSLRPFQTTSRCSKEKDGKSRGDEQQGVQQPVEQTPPQLHETGRLISQNPSVAPRKITHHDYKTRHYQDRPKFQDMFRKLEALSPEEEGTVGSTTLISIDSEQLDKYMPTLDTMKQLIDGVPYEQLPIAFIKAKYNNTIIGVTDYKGTTFFTTSSGREGFKNAKKKTSLAGQATGAAAAQKMIRRGLDTVRVVVSGLGPGRMTSVRALVSGGIKVVSIGDKTPLPELGPRPRKIRRV